MHDVKIQLKHEKQRPPAVGRGGTYLDGLQVLGTLLDDFINAVLRSRQLGAVLAVDEERLLPANEAVRDVRLTLVRQTRLAQLAALSVS